MKRLRVVFIVFITTFVLLGLLFWAKPTILAGAFYKYKLFNQSAELYEYSYSRNPDPRILENIAMSYYSSHDYKKSIMFFSKLLNEKEYLKTSSSEDLMAFYYLDSLYNNAQKTEFRTYFEDFYSRSSTDKIFIYNQSAKVINKSSISERDDFEYAIRQGEQLLVDLKDIKEDYKVGVYTQIIDSYSKLGDNESARKYKDIQTRIVQRQLNELKQKEST